MAGGGQRKPKRARAARHGAAPTSVPRPAPVGTTTCMSAVCNLAAMRDRDKADLRASNPRVRTTGTRTRSPDTKCAPANHGRERSARDLNSRPSATTASWPSARQGAALSHDRGRDARPHVFAIAPLNAPRTQRWGRRVWCVPMGVLARRPNVIPGMQTGGALAAPATALGVEGHTDRRV